jgi:hypothetical protein
MSSRGSYDKGKGYLVTYLQVHRFTEPAAPNKKKKHENTKASGKKDERKERREEV